MTFCSRFQGLAWNLQVCFRKNGVLWNSENLSFKTTKISHYFGNENKSQKNTVLPCWMKLLVVRVEKSKLSDLQKFVSSSFLNLYIWCSCRCRLRGLYSSLLIFSKLIQLICLYMWLSNTLWLVALSSIVH